MCGIAGIYKFNGDKVTTEELGRFTDAMAHRGPDGSGYELLNNNSLGLGHRRLSILDLSELGHQPMFFYNRYCITYNGEVYNFQEVKNELKDKGHAFKSNTDTEIILAAYATWGKDCLNRFNGMWAFAIWDSEKKELFLARDRFGIKPLYYLHEPGRRFAFASETRAFKFLDGFQRSFDDKLLQLNLEDPYALEGLGYTPFKNIVQLLPGHYMIVKKDQAVKQKRWWHIKDHLHKEVPVTLEEQAAKFYDLFRDACRSRLISDVPVATALSGGLDSTAVYCTVSDILQKEQLSRFNKDSQRAFTAIFPGLPDDEQDYARKAAEYTGGPIDYISTDYENLAEQITRETELADFVGNAPITAISAVYAGMRKKGIVVSMDGHGVDEMLFGYRDMVYALYNDALWDGKREDAKNYAGLLHAMYPVAGKAAIRERFDKELGQKLKRDKSLLNKVKTKFRKPISAHAFLPVALPSLSNDPFDFSGYPVADRMVYYEFFQHTLPALLRNFDRAGMINSIEIRMPFMDWRLVSYVFSLPAASKIGQGFTKLVLRQAMKDKMPEDLRTRTFKVGIGSPVDFWFNDVLKAWVLAKMEDNSIKTELNQLSAGGHLNSTTVRKAWQQLNLQIIK